MTLEAQITAHDRLDAALARHAGNGKDAEDAIRIQSPEWMKVIRKLAKATLAAFTSAAAAA